MSPPGPGPDDRPGDEPTPPPWDAPPQPPAWDRPEGQQGQQGEPWAPGGSGAGPSAPGYGGQQDGGGHGVPPYGGQQDGGYGVPPYGGQQYGAGYGVPPYGGAPGWQPAPGYPAYGYAPQQTDGKAVTALVLAIASWVLCPVIPAIFSLVLASSSQRDIEASGGRLGGDGLNKASRIVSWINLGLFGLVLAVFVLVLAVAGTAAFEGTATYGTPT